MNKVIFFRLIYDFFIFLILLLILVLWAVQLNEMTLAAVHPALAQSRGVELHVQQALFNCSVAVVVTLSMTWVGLLVINSLLVLPGAAARNISRNMRQYTLFSLLGAVVCGVGGLLLSYAIGSSTGASITLLLAAWFFVTFALRER